MNCFSEFSNAEQQETGSIRLLQSKIVEKNSEQFTKTSVLQFDGLSVEQSLEAMKLKKQINQQIYDLKQLQVLTKQQEIEIQETQARDLRERIKRADKNSSYK